MTQVTRRIRVLSVFLSDPDIATYNRYPRAGARVGPEWDLTPAAIEGRRKRLEPVPSFDADPLPLSSELHETLERFKSSDTSYTSICAGREHVFARVRIDALVAAQREIDMTSVQLKSPDGLRTLPVDDLSLFEFCMRTRPLADPLMTAENGAIFATSIPGGCMVLPSLVRKRPNNNAFEIVTPVVPRPNFVQVHHIGGRFVLGNGHHRALQLLTAGIKRIIAIVFETASLREAGLATGTFFPQETVFADRPPMLYDFADASRAYDDVYAARIQNIVRVSSQVQKLDAPLTVPFEGI